MPQVPVYGGRKVDSRPLPGVRRGPAPSPDSLGEVLTRVGVQLADPLIQAQKDKADQVAHLEASNTLAKEVMTYTRHPDTGVFNTQKGKDAFGLPEQVTDWYEQTASAIAGTLANDRQRLAFARTVAQERDQLRLQTYTHVDREMGTFYEQQYKGGVTLHTSKAIQNWESPLIVGRELDQALAITRDYLGPGADQDAVAAATLGVQTTVHTGVIQQMLAAHQDRAATVYYEAVSAQISGEQQDDIKQALEIGSLRGESQREAARIRQEGGTPDEMIEKAKQIADPEVQDETLQRVKADIATDRALKNQAHEDVMVGAASIVERTKRYEAIPPHLIATMSVGERNSLRTYAKSLQPGQAAIETDPYEYQRLRLMASDDPERFKTKITLTDYLTKLSRADYMRLLELQADMRAGKPKAQQTLDGYRSVTQTVDDVLHIAGIDTGDTAATRASGQAANVALFRQEVDKRIALAQSAGTKVSNEEVREMANQLLTSVVLEKGAIHWGNWFPGGAPLYEDVTKRAYQVTIADVPARDRQLIEQALRAEGYPVTPAAIVNVFVAQHQQQGRVSGGVTPTPTPSATPARRPWFVDKGSVVGQAIEESQKAREREDDREREAPER